MKPAAENRKSSQGQDARAVPLDANIDDRGHADAGDAA